MPPVATLYHFKEVPEATKLETLAELQNACPVAVGATVVFIVTDTTVLELSRVFTVCET